MSAKFEVGQKVIRVMYAGNGRRAGVYEEIITRVGRKYVYIGKVPFNLETGREKIGIGYGSRIFTEEEYVDYRLRQESLIALRDFGLQIYNSLDKLTTLQLERIAAIVKEEH